MTRQDMSVLLKGGNQYVNSRVLPNAYSVPGGSGVEEGWRCTDVCHKADHETMLTIKICCPFGTNVTVLMAVKQQDRTISST